MTVYTGMLLLSVKVLETELWFEESSMIENLVLPCPAISLPTLPFPVPTSFQAPCRETAQKLDPQPARVMVGRRRYELWLHILLLGVSCDDGSLREILLTITIDITSQHSELSFQTSA